MVSDLSRAESELDSRWRAREDYWRRKLGRIRLGVEPINEQLARYRRVTWVLTAIPLFLAVFFLTLFTAFGRPDIGLILIAILLVPIVLVAWLDYVRLARRAERYQAEVRQYVEEIERLKAAIKPN